ncbi:TIM barrel protein [Candidatus Undinarchaeota archaeon]
MDIGIKLFSEDLPIVREFIDVADYLEIMIQPDFPYAGLKEYDLPYTIHAPHHKFGVNIADSTLLEHNLRRVHQSVEAADYLNADWIILHPGELINDYCSIENAKIFLDRIADDRIILENLPYKLKDYLHLTHTPDEMKEFLDVVPGICLDFAHTVAGKPGEDYKTLIREFAKMKPKVFHISDSHKSTGIDEHIALGDGDLDLEYFKQIINASKSKKVTIETPPSRRRHMEEVVFLRK